MLYIPSFSKLTSHIRLLILPRADNLGCIIDTTHSSTVVITLYFFFSFQATDLKDCNFSLNMDFTNKRTKFKITAAVQKETAQVKSLNHITLHMTRSHLLLAV